MAATQAQLDAVLGSVSTGGVQSTGTITFSGVPSVGHTVIVNGVTFTAASSPATAYEFAPGGTATQAATNLIAKLQAATDAELQEASYTRSGAIITITYGTAGEAGDDFTIAGTYYVGTAASGTITISGDPDADDTVTVGSDTFTFKASGATGDEVNIVAGDYAAMATALAALIHAKAGVNASAAAGVITVVAASAGTAGNSIALTEDAAGVAVSGSGNLAGGTAASGSRSGATLSGGDDGTGNYDADVIVSVDRMNSRFERGCLAVIAAVSGIVELSTDPTVDAEKAMRQRRVLKDLLIKMAAEVPTVALTTDDRTTISGIVAEKVLKKFAGLNTASTL